MIPGNWSAKATNPQFLGGPRDGESAATVEVAVSHYTPRHSGNVHLYIRRVDGHYDYAGIQGVEA